MSALDLLLKADTTKLKTPEKDIKVKRLSEILGEEVVFKIKALSVNKLEELRETNTKDFNIHAILEGVKEPNLKSQELCEKFGTITPVDTVKAILLPGEIDDVYSAISKLSGYGIETIEEIKKN